MTAPYLAHSHERMTNLEKSCPLLIDAPERYIKAQKYNSFQYLSSSNYNAINLSRL